MKQKIALGAALLVLGLTAESVAQPVLRYSPRLDDGYLAETAQTQSQQHLLAIAQRGNLSEMVTDVLVERY